MVDISKGNGCFTHLTAPPNAPPPPGWPNGVAEKTQHRAPTFPPTSASLGWGVGGWAAGARVDRWTAFAVIRLDGDLYQSVYESFVRPG